MSLAIRWVLILLAFVFLSVGLLSGFAIEAHTNRCCECAQPADPAGCPIFISLRSILHKLTGIFIFSPGILAALVLLKVSLGMGLLTDRRYATSLVAWNVKFSC